LADAPAERPNDTASESEIRVRGAILIMSRPNQSLDVLRAIAILGVLGDHRPYYAIWARAGGYGVDLFFVLSGFLISGLLFQEYKSSGGVRIPRFLIRRGLKIWPSYYLLVIGVGLANLYLANGPGELHWAKAQLIASVFIFQNYLRASSYMALVHTWSIAVEEHFYLALPLLIVCLIRVGRNSDPFRWLPAFSLLIVAGCLMLRLFTLKPEEVPLATQFRIDGLFLGVTLAYLKHFRPAWFDRLSGNYSPILAAIFVAPAFLVDKLDRSMETFGLTGVSLGFFFLVAWSVARTSNNWFVMALARVGVYSYSIYLWHMVILQLFATYHHQLSFGAFWLYMACCVAGGITMAHLVEIPYLKLRDRLFPATQAALPPSALPVAAP
jgi:peptidoglycan/LPS O-acetylase OafA/YrhL